MKEIVIIIGSNAAGKTTVCQKFIEDGYHRINRDLLGGTLEDQVIHARNALSNNNKIVLDNTYPTIESRESIINLGKSLDIPVRCVWLDTSFEESQMNACLRAIDKTGDILMPEDKSVNDPNLFPIAALFAYQNKFDNKKKELPGGKQIPLVSHGFSKVEIVKFKRKWDSNFVNKALILDADDTLRKSTGPEAWPLNPSEIEILPNRKEKIQEYVDKGYILLGISNQSTHENKSYKTPLSVIDQCFEKTNELLGHNIEWHYCKHYRFPVACYCRKPQVGLGARVIKKHNLNPSECIYVGDSTTDKTFAKRCGFKFSHATDFFE